MAKRTENTVTELLQFLVLLSNEKIYQTLRTVYTFSLALKCPSRHTVMPSFSSWFSRKCNETLSLSGDIHRFCPHITIYVSKGTRIFSATQVRWSLRIFKPAHIRMIVQISVKREISPSDHVIFVSVYKFS